VRRDVNLRTTRLVGATLVLKFVLGMMLLVHASPAAAQEECTLDVRPRVAQAGTEFVLSGSGYTPDQLVLQRGSLEPVTIDLDLGNADPFEIPIGSRVGDEGMWTATVSVTGSECEATATFHVTLRNTDLLDGVLAGALGGDLPLVAYLLVIGGGFGIGALAARHLRVAA
jgi:hypothetical protein